MKEFTACLRNVSLTFTL